MVLQVGNLRVKVLVAQVMDIEAVTVITVTIPGHLENDVIEIKALEEAEVAMEPDQDLESKTRDLEVGKV